MKYDTHFIANLTEQYITTQHLDTLTLNIRMGHS